MKTLIIGTLLALTGVSTGHSQAPQGARNTVYIAPNVPRTLTISRAAVTLTTLTIPEGTLLSVTFDTARSVLPQADGRFEFHGNVEIHAMASSQKPPLILEEAMRQSPIQLTATDVDVVIVPR